MNSSIDSHASDILTAQCMHELNGYAVKDGKISEYINRQFYQFNLCLLSLTNTKRKEVYMSNTIQDLMLKAQEIKEKQKALRQEAKAQKSILIQEYTQSVKPEMLEKQIKDAQDLLLNIAKEKALLVANFRQAVKDLKSKTFVAKELLSFVGYAQNNHLPRVNESIKPLTDNIGETKISVKRDDLKTSIIVDIKDLNWRKVLKEDLAKQGIVDIEKTKNIQYKTKLVQDFLMLKNSK